MQRMYSHNMLIDNNVSAQQVPCCRKCWLFPFERRSLCTLLGFPCVHPSLPVSVMLVEAPPLWDRATPDNNRK